MTRQYERTPSKIDISKQENQVICRKRRLHVSLERVLISLSGEIRAWLPAGALQEQLM